MRMHRVLDLFSRDINNQDKVEFVCKSYDLKQLPRLEQESMNSFGQTRLLSIIDYIFY